jgi:hypothetical protein
MKFPAINPCYFKTHQNKNSSALRKMRSTGKKINPWKGYVLTTAFPHLSE